MKNPLDKVSMPLRIRYNYQENPKTALNYAHGVWGGVNQQGEIEMNFYLESDAMPEFSERLIEADGTFGQEEYPADESLKVVNRRIHTKVLFNYHTAKAILEWLEERIENIEEMEDDMFAEGQELKQ